MATSCNACSRGAVPLCGGLPGPLTRPACGVRGANPLGLSSKWGATCCTFPAASRVVDVCVTVLIPRGVLVEARSAPAVDLRSNCSTSVGDVAPVVSCETYAGLADDSPTFYTSGGRKCDIVNINRKVPTCHAFQLIFTLENCCDRVSSGAAGKVPPQVLEFTVNGADRDVCNFEYRPARPGLADPTDELYVTLPNWATLPDPRLGAGVAMTTLGAVNKAIAYSSASIAPVGTVPTPVADQICTGPNDGEDDVEVEQVPVRGAAPASLAAFAGQLSDEEDF